MRIKFIPSHHAAFRQLVLRVSLIGSFLAAFASAPAQDVWTGGGSDANWQTAGNWMAGAAPSPGDSLTFTGAVGLSNTNNFLAGTFFGGLTFAAPAGAFVLNGKSINLGGNITNEQVVTPETIDLPVVLTVAPLVDVTPGGVLVINGILSGNGGLTTVDGGVLNLTADNTFSGPLTIDGGTVTVSSDGNLGAVPGAASPGSIILNGGTLDATTSFTLNPNRGIAVGSASGGLGTIRVDVGYTLNYGGVIADNGGSGGLAKSSFGGLTLSGANTYTGPTIVKNGALTLDFTQAGSPVNNIINSVSPLTLGGETAGVGIVNNSSLILNGQANLADSQTFAGTLVDLGGQVIQANSGTGGSANLALGALTHNSGGTVVIIPPANGVITTTSANQNGILGAWATIGNGTTQNSVSEGTNFAAVGADGIITNYDGYFNWASGTLAGQITSASNVLFASSAAAVIPVDADNAGTTIDVNAIKVLDPPTGSPYSGIFIGTNNTLRLGQYGGILLQENGTPVVTLGGLDTTPQTKNGAGQDYGTLTAGGAPNTPGEIDVTINNGSETSGSFILESQITDNGTGPVKFVKAGPGPMKLDGQNSFSGGLYILQGRIQFAGSEIGAGNPNGGGTGPIYVYPGAELFPSGSGSSPITNAIYIAGNGVSDAVGAIRLSGVFSNGVITLIGDARLGGGATNAPVPIYDQITGNYNLDFGATGNSGGHANGAILYNTANDWTGDTSIVGRSNGNTGSTWLYLGADDVIPNGFGKGNLIVGNNGINSANQCALDMNGFSQTVNGLISAGVAANDFIQNGGSTLSTLTVGNNNQSGTFAGKILDGEYNGTGNGKIALTKIGGGVETLSAVNTYSGNTTVSGGTLALTGSGSIANSAAILIENGALLDVTGETNTFNTPNTLSLITNGELSVDSNVTLGTLNMTNARIRIPSVNSVAAIIATNLSLGGTTNYIDLTSVGLVSGYPVEFPVIRYSGTLSGTFNFGLGKVPSVTTTGYVTNNAANGTVDVVLLSGPEELTWTAANGDNWDIGATINWLAFGTTPSTYEDIDSVIFDDTAASGNVNLTQAVNPGFVEVTNNTLAYTFAGPGSIIGTSAMEKGGAGAFILDNGGANSFSGGFIISAGTVQVGNNDNGGSLPAVGGVEDDSSLVFDRIDDLTVGAAISGIGSVTKNNADLLTLSGNNSFAGALNVLQGTLRAATGTALGATNGPTIISSGATLDINGQSLGAEPVIAAGAGVGSSGAIVNSGPDITTALMNVTLAGDTTFGGTGRWDIRGTGAQLSTSGNSYNLTKIGTNQVSLVNVTVDGSLGNINVMSGTFSIEEGTTGLGNSSSTLTVAGGATFQVYASTANLSKQFVLNGDGMTTTLNCGSGSGNVLSGNFTLNGGCIFNAAAGTSLTLANGTLSGTGSLTKVGLGTNILSSSSVGSYTGGTVLSNGTLVVDGTLGGALNVYPGATLTGGGTAGGNLNVLGGTMSPGDGIGTLTVGGNLSLSNGTVVLQLSDTPVSGNDKLVVSGGLSLSGTNTLQIAPLAYMNVGDIYTLMTYGGSPLPSSASNNIMLVATSPGFSFSLVDPATTPGSIQIKVLTAVGNDIWTGQTSSAWDTSTVNWNRNGSAVNFNNGDFVTFDNSSTATNVNLAGILQAGNIMMNNSSEAYHFGGTGSLAGVGGLTLASGGGLIIANAGTNTFSGPIFINSGVLQIGDGSTNGNLGSGGMTNNGSLVFDRSDAGLTISNVISGSGSLTNIGAGTVTLAGANSFVGAVTVQSGTLRTLNNTALGNALSSYTYVSNGASLDLGANNVNLGAEPINVSGPGVAGNGAIINSSGSSTFVGPNIGQVIFLGDTTVGGSGRIDFRASSASANDATLTMSPLESPYTLTKVGTNQFQLAGVQIDPGLGNIDVQGGIFGLQWQTEVPGLSQSLGDPSYTLHLHSGTTLNLYDVSNALDKVLVMDDGATVYDQHGTNLFVGPVTLNGTENFNTANALTLTGSIGGNGNLLKTGISTLWLSTGPETYTGNTYVNAGTLALTDVAALTNSPAIVLSNATIDVSARSDGTLTVGAAINQTLAGGGGVNGILVENAGSVVNPGNGVTPAVLTISNPITLNGSVVMDVNQAAGAVTNDEIIAPGISAAGTIMVTNLGPDLITGAKFQLFSVAVSGTPAVNLPSHNASGTIAYTWQNNLANDGSITLLSGATGVSTTPTNIVFSVGSGGLTLSWPSDHIGWTLQVQANPLSAGLGTNWVAVPGSTTVDSMTIPIGTTNGSVFYRLVYQH